MPTEPGSFETTFTQSLGAWSATQPLAKGASGCKHRAMARSKPRLRPGPKTAIIALANTQTTWTEWEVGTGGVGHLCEHRNTTYEWGAEFNDFLGPESERQHRWTYEFKHLRWCDNSQER